MKTTGEGNEMYGRLFALLNDKKLLYKGEMLMVNGTGGFIDSIEKRINRFKQLYFNEEKCKKEMLNEYEEIKKDLELI